MKIDLILELKGTNPLNILNTIMTKSPERIMEQTLTTEQKQTSIKNQSSSSLNPSANKSSTCLPAI